MTVSTKTLLAAGAAAVVAMPPLVFLGVALRSGLGFGESLQALVAQATASRLNLLVLGALGLVPVLLLVAVLLVARRIAPTNPHRPALALGGLLPILAVLLFVHLDYWPLFLPSQTYPGFPHGIGFVVGPLVFAPVGMAVGLVLAWLVSRAKF